MLADIVVQLRNDCVRLRIYGDKLRRQLCAEFSDEQTTAGEAYGAQKDQLLHGSYFSLSISDPMVNA
ncbi:MAG: hypothetical protein EA376_06640 [Phycisphaeraceae bacterium]|nr:MAG: hypothetical protein EA376_06640 [Phycisphaeraceae bacterium]